MPIEFPSVKESALSQVMGGMGTAVDTAATSARPPRERQFQVVPVPGAFTRGRWHCRDYRSGELAPEDELAFSDMICTLQIRSPLAEQQALLDDPQQETSSFRVTSVAPAQHSTPVFGTSNSFDNSLQLGFASGRVGTLNFSQSLPQARSLPKVEGEEENATSFATQVAAIDNKIEQAMDLVKTHLTFAVREEVDGMRATISELEAKIAQLESENQLLLRLVPPEIASQLPVLAASQHLRHPAPNVVPSEPHVDASLPAQPPQAPPNDGSST